MCCLVIRLLPIGATINAFVRKFLVSKQTAVLRRCDSKICKFAFIKRVDKVRITAVKDAES